MTTRLVTALVLLSLAAISVGIRCWRCGTYSDGVGSITPCINRSTTRLEQCPGDSKFCISRYAATTTLRCIPALLTRFQSQNQNQTLINEYLFFSLINLDIWLSDIFCRQLYVLKK
ncbi:hypothetical protein K1T71_013754 [Dendrolimus kikuchii]|uniref:Uncharacterized protein n=1 Tax=Dendrolimus kikuchii TaxID=765133 RepID=A0ACC1CHN0_9NEOP|nr:hypothetical protein K1T71_013754 [Dendrolimus kikuchii]